MNINNKANVKTLVKKFNIRKKVFYSLVPIALAGPVIFQFVSLLLPFFDRGYNIVHDAVSALVFGSYGWLQTVGFYSFGISLMALAVIVFIKAKAKFHAGSLLLAGIGLGFVMIGTFKGNGPGQPPGVSGVIHLISVGMVVVAFPIACLMIAPSLKKWGYHGLRFYTIAVAVFAALFMAVGGPVLAMHFSLTGLFERVLLGNGQLWILLLCAQLVIDDMRKRRRFAFAYARTGKNDN